MVKLCKLYKFIPGNFSRADKKIITSTLHDPRGWTTQQNILFLMRRGQERSDIDFEMASSDEIGRRFGRRFEKFSVCHCGPRKCRIVINGDNWKGSTVTYKKYIINHEIGHALGHEHRTMPSQATSRPCHVMVVQTARRLNCRLNPWLL